MTRREKMNELILQNGSTNKINKSSPMPIYYQVYELIKEDILAKGLQEGDKLPSESEYLQVFGISRVTLRKSLELLEKERIITRAQGRGSFIHKLEQPIIHDFSLPTTQNRRMHQRNIEFDRKMVSLFKMQPSEKIQSLLKMDDEEHVYYLGRIFYYDDRPISFNESWMRGVFIPDFDQVFQKPYNLTETLDEQYDIEVNRIENTISAALPTEEEIEHLSIDYSTPLIVLTSLSLIHDGQPFEYSRTSWISSRMRFLISSDN